MNDSSPLRDEGRDEGRDDAVSVTEIADFFRQLRGLSGRPVPAGGPSTDQTTQRAGERAAFLARKTDLLARIAAHHPDLAPPPSPADGDPADGDPS
jgi:hypothetical protein